MDILLISQARILRDALVAALQGVHGNQTCGASSHETVEAALAASAPGLVVIDASHPEGAALVATVRGSRHKADARFTLSGTDQELGPKASCPT